MEEKSTRSSSPSPSPSPSPSSPVPPPRRAESWSSDPTSSEPRRDEAWRPRVENQRELHGFEGKTPEADSILESPQIRDPEEDTAPLQGTNDRSDDDSLEPEE